MVEGSVRRVRFRDLGKTISDDLVKLEDKQIKIVIRVLIRSRLAIFLLLLSRTGR